MSDKYNNSSAIVNKILNEDGSVTKLDGTAVDMSVASDIYKKSAPIINKVLNPDGSISKLTDYLGGGGGGGGTTDYNALNNKPSINGVTLSGNKTSEQLQLADKQTLDKVLDDIAMMDNEIDTLSKDTVSLSKTTTQTLKSPLSITNDLMINGDTNAFKIEVNENGSALLNSNDLIIDKLPKTNDETNFDELLDNQLVTKKMLKEQSGGGVDPSLIDSKISEHNLSNQSHNDIRNSLNAKANLASVATEQIGNIAIIDKDGQYETSNTKLSNINEDIDILNQQTGLLTTSINDIKDDYASKTKDNTFTGKNKLQGDLVLGSNIKNSINDKVILTTKTINNNTQSTYIGGDEVEIYAPDKLSIESEDIQIKRNSNTYKNIDSGNINEYISGGGDVADKYGIEADYAIHYGILDCPNGLIDTNITNKTVTINPGIVLKLAGTEGKTVLASKQTYDIEESGKLTLFLAKTSDTQLGFLEAGEVFYQEEEPSNGVTSYLAWWKPSRSKWQFKSIATGNVWREAIATPIANITINESNTGVLNIDYIGYRILDDDIIAQMSDIESIEDKIQTINTNVSTLSDTVDAYGYLINQDRQEITDLKNNKANKDELPTKVSQLTNDSNFVDKTYVDGEVAKIKQFNYTIVSTLPTTGQENTIYLVSKTDGSTENVYNEYMWINNKWELIGDTAIDLTGYATETYVNNKVSQETTARTNADNTLQTNIDKKQDKLTAGTNISIDSNNTIKCDIAVMKGATSTAVGVGGTVPTPVAGENVKFLRGDGKWVQFDAYTKTEANNRFALRSTVSNLQLTSRIPNITHLYYHRNYKNRVHDLATSKIYITHPLITDNDLLDLNPRIAIFRKTKRTKNNYNDTTQEVLKIIKTNYVIAGKVVDINKTERKNTDLNRQNYFQNTTEPYATFSLKEILDYFVNRYDKLYIPSNGKNNTRYSRNFNDPTFSINLGIGIIIENPDYPSEGDWNGNQTGKYYLWNNFIPFQIRKNKDRVLTITTSKNYTLLKM